MKRYICEVQMKGCFMIIYPWARDRDQAIKFVDDNIRNVVRIRATPLTASQMRKLNEINREHNVTET